MTVIPSAVRSAETIRLDRLDPRLLRRASYEKEVDEADDYQDSAQLQMGCRRSLSTVRKRL